MMRLFAPWLERAAAGASQLFRALPGNTRDIILARSHILNISRDAPLFALLVRFIRPSRVRFSAGRVTSVSKFPAFFLSFTSRFSL